MQPNFLRQLKPSTNGKHLICFPFAGGYSTAFRPMAQHFDSEWGVIAVEPPGHGMNRLPLMDNMDELVDFYMEHLTPKLGAPFALFGHSMGALIVYMMAQRLEKIGLFPEVVFASGANPPDIVRFQTTHLNEQEFIDYVYSLGGLSKELLENRELLDLFLPVLRADFTAVERFNHQEKTLVQAPVHVFSGRQDERCTPEMAKGWGQWVRKADFYEFNDGHMFILSEPERVAKQVTQILHSRVMV